jgi:hypothetical protein
MKPLVLLAMIAGALACSATRASAQVDFTGKWTLDRDLSADLTKASFEPQQAQAPRNTGFNSGFGGRGGYGGRSGGGSGGSRRPPDNSGSKNGAASLTADEHARLREIADYVKGLTSITIDHTDHSTFTVTDAQGRARLFPTDGSKTQHAFATSTIESTTRWDGPHMVTAYTISSTRELVFTYILVPASHQMALRIKLDDSGHQRADVPELRLVYKLTH